MELHKLLTRFTNRPQSIAAFEFEATVILEKPVCPAHGVWIAAFSVLTLGNSVFARE